MNCESRMLRSVTAASPDAIVATIEREDIAEHFISVQASGDSDPARLLEQAASLASQAGAEVVSVDVFGLPASAARTALRSLGSPPWPVTWVEGEEGRGAAGVQVWAVAGGNARPVDVGGRVLGTVFEDGAARYCRLGGLTPDPGDDPCEQTRSVFALMEDGLQAAGMDFRRVARTWFFNSMILDWYGPFNGVRTRYFRENGVFGRLVPASTGIGGRNPQGAALTAGLLAVEPLDPDTRVSAVRSPLQGAALDYGSSFSRAVEIAASGCRRVLVSGTASIDPAGSTAHVGDLEAQVDLTMNVVGGILEDRDLGWAHVVRGVVYARDPEGADAYRRWAYARDLAMLPVVVTRNVICRDDLLFEVEVDAIGEMG